MFHSYFNEYAFVINYSQVLVLSIGVNSRLTLGILIPYSRHQMMLEDVAMGSRGFEPLNN